jgi:hypothetical protein
VSPEKAGDLLDRLTPELEGTVDPETGAHPVAKVYRRDELYRGELTPQLPELLVGYARGYRNSSASVLGGTGSVILDLNPWAWSGDHSMACDLVPGALLSSRPLTRPRPSLLDLPVTLLDWFGIPRPERMVGCSLFG